jgi:hypothetical protein
MRAILPAIATARRSIVAVHTRAIAARHLGAPWGTVLRAALGDARAFASTPHRLAAPVHQGTRGVRL